MSDLLTTAQAADLAGITPAAFRKAASTDPALREAKTMIDGRTPGYPRTAVEAWRTATPRRTRVASVVGLVVLALLGLGACGGAEAPAAAQETVAVQPSAEVEPSAEPSEDVDLRQPGARREIVRRVEAGECFSISFGSTAVEWSEWMGQRPEDTDGSQWATDFRAWIGSQPNGCDDTDRQALSAFG